MGRMSPAAMGHSARHACHRCLFAVAHRQHESTGRRGCRPAWVYTPRRSAESSTKYRRLGTRYRVTGVFGPPPPTPGMYQWLQIVAARYPELRAWWFMGALPRDVDDIGPVDTIQEETVRVHRTDVVASGQAGFVWKEVGVFRDIMTGEVSDHRFDPVTGTSTKAGSLLGGGGRAA